MNFLRHRKSGTLSALFLTLAAVGCARLPEPGRLTGNASAVEVPAELRGDHVLTRVELAGDTTEWLLLDTGAQLSALDVRLAEGIDQSQVGRSTLTGYGAGRVEGGILADLSFRVPGTEPFTRNTPVVDLSPVDPYAGFRFHGFLGASLFFRFVVEIDYAGERVVLHDPERFRPNPTDVRLPLDIERGTPFVDATIELDDGTLLPGRFVLDTGMRNAISLGSPFVAGHDLLARVGPTIPQRVVGIGGVGENRLGRIASFRLGTLSLAATTVELATTGDGIAGATDRAGGIGGALLRRFTVTVDFRDRALYLRPNGAFGEPFEGDMSGASFLAGGDELRTLVVHDVYDDSPAAAAGLLPGDTLLTVDGRDASDIRLWELRDLLRSEAGRSVEFVVRRGDTRVTVTVILERRV